MNWAKLANLKYFLANINKIKMLIKIQPEDTGIL